MKTEGAESSQFNRSKQLHLQFVEEFWNTENKKTEWKNLSVSDLVKFFFTNDEKRRGLDDWILHKGGSDKDCLKNKTIAEASHKNGVSLFIKPDDSDKFGRLQECLKAFNDALLHSAFEEESDRIETSKRFANRSAVFYDLRRYEHSLQDIETALRLGYPFHPKVWIRKARILVQQFKPSEAKQALAFIKESLALTKQELQKVEEIEKNISALENAINENNRCNITNEEKNGNLNRRRFNRTPFIENSSFQYASQSINIAFDNERTRHIVAAEQIQPGDILFDEIPYASILLPDCIPEYCYHCHSHLAGYIFPCRTCSEVKYCSESCDLESWTEYHNIECQNTSLLRKVGLLELATRIVLKAGVDQVLETISQSQRIDDNRHKNLQDSVALFQRNTEDDQAGIGAKRLEYLRIYSLHHHLNKMNPLDVFTYAKTAAAITSWLQKRTSFFKGRSDEEIWQVGGTILWHLLQLISNAQRLYSYGRDGDFGVEQIKDDERVVIGSGIYACTSLMNHSCDPNISTNYKFKAGEGRRLIVKATRQISAGEEVSNSYGVTYRRHDFRNRKSSMLQQYFFVCSCKNCQEEEKNCISFTDDFESFKCISPSCEKAIPYRRSEDGSFASSACPSCSTMFSKSDSEVSLAKAERVLEFLSTVSGKISQSTIQKSFDFLNQLLAPNHRLIAEAHDSVAKYLIGVGDAEGALSHLRKSLDYVITKFGPTSNEYGIELRKYGETLALCGRETDCFGEKTKDIRERGLKCLEIYFPSTD